MDKNAIVRSGRVVLRPVDESDLVRLVEWRNAPGIREFFFNRQPLTVEGQLAWYKKLQDDASRAMWVIHREEDQLPIGTLGLSDLDAQNHSVEFGNMLIGVPECQGQGYAKEATLALLSATVQEWGVHRIYLHVYAENTTAVELYRRCGFAAEGKLRDAHWDGEDYRDVLLMSILESEVRSMGGG